MTYVCRDFSSFLNCFYFEPTRLARRRRARGAYFHIIYGHWSPGVTSISPQIAVLCILLYTRTSCRVIND